MKLSDAHIGLLILALGAGCDGATDGSCAAGAPFPAPRFVQNDGIVATAHTVCISASDLGLDASSQMIFDAAVERLVSENGLALGERPACPWAIDITPDALPLDGAAIAALGAAPASGRWAAETVVIDSADGVTTVQADDAATAINALRVLLAAGGALAEGTIVDGPTFASRGIIEGSYASPLGESDRSTTIELLARLRGNVYMYAPKSDEFVNQRWADPYPSAELETIAKAAALARSRFVDFYWAVSPGWRADPSTDSIEYGSDDDFARLTAKIDQLLAAGVEHFALFVDDTRSDFAWPADATRFPSIAAAHAFLANRLESYVTALTGTDLWFVGMHYSFDPDWLAYNTTLGGSLDPRVTVLWTGDSVYSRTIDASDLESIDLALQRNVAIWDNAPFHVLPLDGRSADLSRAASGYLVNTVLTEAGAPIEDFWAIFGTIADYAWDSSRYAPTTSITQWARVRPCLVMQLRN